MRNLSLMGGMFVKYQIAMLSRFSKSRVRVCLYFYVRIV
jgi:hypothetical protein